MLVYIHGFNSSPESFKAGLLQRRLDELGRAREFRAPRLSHWPKQAIGQLEDELRTAAPAESVTLLGSSLGGFYATWLAERMDLRAVLVNPAVRPYESLRDYLGPQKNLHSGEEYVLTSEHLAQLEALEIGAITRPERYLILVTTGDEVLDYRQAVEKYRGARQIVIPGGDHGFGTFGDYLDPVLEFHGSGI